MKKVIIPILVAVLFTFTSCKKEETKVNTDVQTSENSSPQSAPQPATTDNSAPASADNNVATTIEIPKFSSPELDKFAAEYGYFMNEMKEAYKKKDAAAIQNLATKQQEWANKSTVMSAKFNTEDAQKWAAYSQKIAEDMQATIMKN